LNRLHTNKNYYEVLGASASATPREIERLYKRLAHQHHPDRGGSEEEMKTLNEAYRILHDETSRKAYDSLQRQPVAKPAAVNVTPTARDVGLSGQMLSAVLCLLAGLMLLFMVRFNGLWFLWPLSILAGGVILFGVIMAHTALVNARESFAAHYPVLRLRLVSEIAFWSLVGAAVYGVYLVLTTI
jgi:hypothetical protein